MKRGRTGQIASVGAVSYYDWEHEHKECGNEHIFIEMRKAPVKNQWFY